MPKIKYQSDEERRDVKNAKSREYYEIPENQKKHIESSMSSYKRTMSDPVKAAARRKSNNEAGRRFREKRKNDPEYKAKVNASHTAWRQKMLADPETAVIIRAREKKARDKKRLAGKIAYTTDHTNVENYAEAAKVDFDNKKFVCHHRLENYYRQETLQAKNMYYGLPASQLIWMDTEEHRTDSSLSISAPLDSKYHKALFEILKNTLDLSDRNKLPEEFEKLVSDVDDHYFDYLTEEYLGREKLTEFMEIYHKIESFKKEFLHYYMAMYLVELGKKNLW